MVTMGRATLHVATLHGDYTSWFGGDDVREFTDAFDYGKPVYPDQFTFRRAGQ